MIRMDVAMNPVDHSPLLLLLFEVALLLFEPSELIKGNFPFFFPVIEIGVGRTS